MAEFIPRTSGPQVEVDRGPQIRNTVQYDDSGGQAIARAVGGIADQVHDYAKQQIAQEDTAAVLAARRELSEWEHSTFDPANPEGIAKYQGLNALGANDALMPDLDKRVAKISERLTPRQRAQFDTVALNFRDGVGTRLNGYMDKEHTAARKAESEASIGSLLRDAATAGMNGDMTRQEELLAEAQAANELRFQSEGQGEAVIRKSNAAAVSSVRRQTIESVATTDPFAAQELLGKHRDELEPEDRAKLESTLYPVIEDAQAGERFDSWLAGAPSANPNSYHDPGQRGQPSPQVRQILDEEADAAGIPREYLYAIVEQESAFNPSAVNSETLDDGDNATGLLQYRASSAGGIDRMDPRASAARAAREFKARMDAHGPEFAIAAHFAGDGGAAAVVQRGRAAQNPRTALYVQEVMGRADRWRGGPVAGQDVPAPAGAAPSKADAMEYARSIRNPSQRQAFLRRANEHFAIEDMREQEGKKAWSERVNTAMQQADPTQPLARILGTEDYALAVREGKVPALETLRLHQIQGTFVQDDLQLKETIAREAVTDPDAFMKRDFNDPELQANLATDSLARFVSMQAEASKPGKRDEWASESQLLGQAYTETGLAGGGKANAKKRDDFERAYLREKRAFNEAHNGRNPTASEMQTIINGLKLPMIREYWWRPNQQQLLYRAGEGTQVPASERVQIIAGLRAAGIESPTEAQVVEAYRRGAGGDL